MRRVDVVLVGVAACLLFGATAPAARSKIVVTKVKAKAAPRKRAPAPVVKKVVPPGPADAQSLGFGSPGKDVERLLGKPTRVEKVERREIWFYDHSTVTLGAGRVIAWSTYDRKLPMNIGAAKPGAPPVKMGMTMEQLVAAKGTPATVVVHGNQYLWFYGTVEYIIRDGKVAPSDVIMQLNTKASKEEAPSKRTTTGQTGGGGKCWCPL